MDSQKLLSIIASLYKFSSTAPSFIEKIISHEVPLKLIREKTREGAEWDSNMALWNYSTGTDEIQILFQAKSDVWYTGTIFHYLAHEDEWDRFKDRHVTITTLLGEDSFAPEDGKTIDNEMLLDMLGKIIHYRNMVLFWKSINTYAIHYNELKDKNPDWIENDMGHFFGMDNPYEPSREYWMSVLLVLTPDTVVKYLDALVAKRHLSRAEIMDKHFISSLENGIYHQASHLDDTEDTRDWVKSCWKGVVKGIKAWQNQN